MSDNSGHELTEDHMTDRTKSPHNGFAESISGIRREDIVRSAERPKKKKGQIVSGAVRIAVMILCAAVFVYCMFTIVQNLLGYAEAQDYYDKLADIWRDDTDWLSNPGGALVYSQKDYSSLGENENCGEKESGNSATLPFVPAESDEMMRIRARLGALYRQNSDLIAWISIPGTIIDYPVVQTDNNDYYLNHSFNRDYLLAGTIFADYRNDADPLYNYNTVLYGHNLNLTSGTMFSILSKYFTKSFLDEHPDVYIYTNGGIYIYRIFNVAKVAASSGYIRSYFPDGASFVEFANKMAAKSVHKDENLTFDEGDRILTLSTCTNAHISSERYCIQAKLVEIRR